MSGIRLVLACLLVCLVTTAGAQETFPYQARVAKHGALAYSGPGQQFYATDTLQPGTRVEVWRRDADGWMAVRPPKSSFSLIASDAVRRVAKSDVAEVVGDEVVAWVGSNLDVDGDYKWQIQLKAGERVVLLGQERRRLFGSESPSMLYRVAPPAGEFRWVAEDELVKDTETTDGDGVHLADFRVVVDEEPEESKHGDDFVARRPDRPGTSRAATAGGLRVASREPPRKRTGQSLKSHLRDLEVRLSLAVADTPENWELEPLRDEASSFVREGTTILERGRAERLLNQIEEFESWRKRFNDLGVTEGDTVEPGSLPADARPPEQTNEFGLDPRFDGTGWLLPVHSRKRTAPPYALLDGEGRILQFVSPSPGLNLHRYLRKEIGIYGQKSYIPSLEKRHLTAHRVVDLDRHRR